ncbi:helix-turn-helix domain-containing protein [Caulobacter sp. 602-1]|uniref:winged helix-turn-helix transcriptional regulator n=1 Tax=Caulobacter sp. 602-1 TaxID=2492472 RepID=UPI000F62EBB0|nr:helix-turn-helix domain-containing protein [Caulobacter sp. 602-1]RRN63521.1 transcriptional regulator [Caulobacter sp. 602-1]
MTTKQHNPINCQRVNALMGYMGDRWTLPVLMALGAGARRFNQLRRDVDGISQQMLARVVKGLERDGMVTRTVHPSVPPQVEYALTSLGASLTEQGVKLGDWAVQHIDEVDAHRERYDAAVSAPPD